MPRQNPHKQEHTAPSGKIRVTRTSYVSGDKENAEPSTDEESTVEVPLFETTPAQVSVVGSTTLNLGNYEFARVEVSVSLPCYPEESEVTKTYEAASSFVDQFIGSELEALQEEISGGSDA